MTRRKKKTIKMFIEKTKTEHILPVGRYSRHLLPDDRMVYSSDTLHIPSYKETYRYEANDKRKTINNLIGMLQKNESALEVELAKDTKNNKRIAHIRGNIQDLKKMLTERKDFIEKNMKLNFAQIVSVKTL